MKDLMKRLLCVLMALMMVMALVACGESDEDEGRSSKRGNKETTGETTEETTEETTTEPEPTLAGEWEAEVDMTDYINEMLGAELGVDDVVDEFTMKIVLELNEDGTCEMVIDQDHMEDMVEAFADSIWDIMVEMVAEEADITAAEAEEALEESGMTKDMLLEEMDVEALFEDMDDMKGYWLLDGDELFIAEDEDDVEDSDPIEIEFEGGDTFSMVGGDGLTDGLDDEMAEVFLPLVFNRV